MAQEEKKSKSARKARRTQRAQDFANQKIQSAKDFNFDQHNRKGVEGTHISGQEVRHLRGRHKTHKGANVRDTYAALQEQKEAGATFGGRAQKQMDRMGARIEKLDARQAAKEKAQAAQSVPPAEQPQETHVNVDKDTSITDPDTQQIGLPQPGQTGNTYEPPGGNHTGIKNTQEQNVNQDNDINTNIDGNGNYVVNNQDNSIRQYGGDNRSFVYNGSGDGTQDMAGTMATLAGFYDVDDSPGATAARLDQHITMNRDNQKQFQNTSHIAQGAIHRAGMNSYIDPKAIDQRVRGREQNSYDRASLMSKNLWGDLSNMQFNWSSNKDAEPIEQPDFEKMKDDYTDF